MLTDGDYPWKWWSHSAQVERWTKLADSLTQQDAGGNSQSVVVAGRSIAGKDYEYLIMKKAKLKMTVRLKREEYRKNKPAELPSSSCKANNTEFEGQPKVTSCGNGEDDSPNQSAHARQKDKAKVRFVTFKPNLC